MRARLLVLFSLLATVLGCNRRSGAGTSLEQPAPSASVMTIAVELGACEDMAVCERECDAGSADRCRRIGVSYEFGKGAPRDPTRATRLYEQACTMGDAEACLSAGRMYEFHHGVDKDDTKAASYYALSCDMGDSAGCANYAIMLESGRGVPKDEARASVLFDQACARGATLACERAKVLRMRSGG